MFQNKKFKYLVYYITGVMILLLILNSVLRSARTEHIKYSEFEKMVEQKAIEEVQISDNQIIIVPKEKKGVNQKIKYTSNIERNNIRPLIDKVHHLGLPSGSGCYAAK